MLSTRAYSVSAVKRQQQRPGPSANSSAQSREYTSEQRSQNETAPSPPGDALSYLDARLDFRTPNQRTSRFPSSKAQYANRTTTAYDIPSGSSADDAAARYNGASRSGFGNEFDSLLGRPTSSTGSGVSELFGFMMPKQKQKNLVEPPDPATLPRLGPSVGRSVSIRDNVDLAKGLRQLDIICGRNRIRGEANRQRYHERPGLKRKRLASERWRRRFMEGFQATVSRVQYLKRQGW